MSNIKSSFSYLFLGISHSQAAGLASFQWVMNSTNSDVVDWWPNLTDIWKFLFSMEVKTISSLVLARWNSTTNFWVLTQCTMWCLDSRIPLYPNNSLQLLQKGNFHKTKRCHILKLVCWWGLFGGFFESTGESHCRLFEKSKQSPSTFLMRHTVNIFNSVLMIITHTMTGFRILIHSYPNCCPILAMPRFRKRLLYSFRDLYFFWGPS